MSDKNLAIGKYICGEKDTICTVVKKIKINKRWTATVAHALLPPQKKNGPPVMSESAFIGFPPQFTKFPDLS